MSRDVYFITHPDVLISPNVPVPQWPLSERGRTRMRSLLARDWIASIGSLYCSTEQKAIDGAVILSEATGIPYHAIETLGENDRSATGYLPKAEFEATADAFFAHPDESIRGWEPAAVAQARIVKAVEEILRNDANSDAIAIVAHGGVGTLLLCHLKDIPISRQEDQPGGAGGNYFHFQVPEKRLIHGWLPIDTDGKI